MDKAGDSLVTRFSETELTVILSLLGVCLVAGIVAFCIGLWMNREATFWDTLNSPVRRKERQSLDGGTETGRSDRKFHAYDRPVRKMPWWRKLCRLLGVK